jgi:hypothetical protein
VVHTWGFCVEGEETVAERARFSLEMAMFLSREGINERYLCAMSNTEYRGPDARGLSATIPNRTYHVTPAVQTIYFTMRVFTAAANVFPTM